MHRNSGGERLILNFAGLVTFPPVSFAKGPGRRRFLGAKPFGSSKVRLCLMAQPASVVYKTVGAAGAGNGMPGLVERQYLRTMINDGALQITKPKGGETTGRLENVTYFKPASAFQDIKSFVQIGCVRART